MRPGAGAGRRRTGDGQDRERLSAVTNVATWRASSVESARRTASIGFLDSTRSSKDLTRISAGEYGAGTLVALACLGIGDREQAMSWLHRAADQRDALLP